MECAQAGDNIRVNSLHPGTIDTPIWDKLPHGDHLRSSQPIDANELAKVRVPVGRAGRAQEIADGVLFLASDASRYITGTELIIDGGITAGSVRRTLPEELKMPFKA
jgi:NAD(P)-dependent dehydrogenase (short-subunit alcohol dehydrogenase family)